MANEFVSNPGTSRWQVTSPGRRLVRSQTMSQARQRLMADAQALTPSSAELAERLSKHKLSGGDALKFQGIIQNEMNDYLNKYTENPYYAFSREGKEAIKRMHSVANNPNLTGAENVYDTSKKVYDEVRRKNHTGSINVRDGAPRVYNTETGSIEWINPADFDARKHQLYTPEAEMNYREKNGFINDNLSRIDDPLEFSMASFNEAMTMINNVLSTPGSTEYNTFQKELSDADSYLQSTVKSNEGQIRKKVDSLLSVAGMPSNYRDALISTAYQNIASRSDWNGKLDYNEAAKEVIKTISDLAEGKVATSYIQSESPVSRVEAKKASAAGGSGPLTQTGPYFAALSGVTTTPASKIQYTDERGNTMNTTGHRLPDNLFLNPDYSDKSGMNRTGYPLGHNPVYGAVAAPGAALTTTDGIRIDPKYALPAPEPNMITYTKTIGGRELTFVQFDAIVGDNGPKWGDKGVYDSKAVLRKADDVEEKLWDNTEALMAKGFEAGRIESSFGAAESEAWYWNEDRYRVRVEVPMNPDADAHAMFLDGNSLQAPKTMLNPFQPGLDQQVTRIEDE